MTDGAGASAAGRDRGAAAVHPLELAAAVLWAGTAVPTRWHIVGAAVVVLLAAVCWRRVRVVGLLCGLLLLGSGLAGGRHALMDRAPLTQLAYGGGATAITATVVSDPRATPFGSWFIVRTGSATGNQRALVQTATNDAPEFGERVRFEATARPLDDDGFERHLRNLGVRVELSPIARIERRKPPWPVGVSNGIRARIRAATAAWLPADAAGLLTGLVTGDTSLLSAEAQDGLTAAGLSHLVAVSGSNVALVIAGAFALGASMRVGARGRRRIALVAVIGFVVIVRAEPSVLRAAVMAVLVLGGRALGRGSNARHALAAAVVVLLLSDPLLGSQLGFALSVLATAGVLLLAPALSQRLPGPPRLRALLGATLGAQLAVAPVLLAATGGVPLAAVPANVIAVPAAAVASAIGVAGALLAQVSVGLGGAVSALAWPAVSVVLWSGSTFAAGPQVTAASLLTPVAAALAVALVLRRRVPGASAVALVAAAVMGVVPAVRPAGNVTALTVTALDVGQGDAILVEAPAASGTARMLIDGGPDPLTALRLLRGRGVRKLDAVVVSHPHADHTDGLVAVLSRMPVGALVVGPDPVSQLDDPAPSASAVLAVARGRRIPVVPVAAGQVFALGAAEVSILSPPADGALGLEPNENSLVMRVADAHGSVLLTGDAEEAAQRRLLARPDLLQADVIKIPHHGGDTNAEGFLDAVGAHTAVIGVGADNDYGHPHPDVLADLSGAKVLRTDTDGTVSVTFE